MYILQIDRPTTEWHGWYRGINGVYGIAQPHLDQAKTFRCKRKAKAYIKKKQERRQCNLGSNWHYFKIVRKNECT